MSTCRTCVAIDCEQTNRYKYSLQSEVYPFVLNCPAGFDCQGGGGFFVTFVACDGVSASRYIPQGATAAQYRALIAECVAEVALRAPYCVDADGVPTTPEQPWLLYWNRPQSCTVYCQSGNPFTYTVPAGRYCSFSELTANQIAEQEACRLAEVHKICLGDLDDKICIGATQSITLKATGNLGTSQQQNQWVVSSGSLPTGLSLTPSSTGKKTTITGIATAAGTYNFTIRVFAPDGDYGERSYTMQVYNISPASLPNATVGSYYFEWIKLDPLTFDVAYTFQVVGTLPDGLTLSQPVAGVPVASISGTPTGGNLPATFSILLIGP